MIRGIVIGAVAALLLAATAGYLILVSGLVPANADAEPGAVEQWLAGTALEAALAAQAPRQPNPVALSDASLAEGAQLYARHCAVCHGAAAGETPAPAIARGEYPPPPQLASDGVEDDPEGWTYWKIKHGIRLTGMPSWKTVLDDREIWTLALFLKHMDKLPPAILADGRKASPS